MRSCSAEQKVILFDDYEGAVRRAKNPLSSLRIKHIGVRYHFIRSEVKEERVDVKGQSFSRNHCLWISGS